MPSAQNITNSLSKTAVNGTTVMTPTETIANMTKGFDWMGILKWVGIFLLVGLIIGCIYIAVSQNKLIATPQNVANNAATQKGAVDTNLAQFYTSHAGVNTALPAELGEALQTNEKCFINYSPLTIQHAGFLGPKVNGIYGEKDAVTMALKTGARCFVLNIDYYGNDTTLNVDLFGNPNQPILLYRDSSYVIRSTNAGDIGKVAQSLADLAFGNLVNNPNDPLIVVLYFVNTPDPKSQDYLPFLSKVATKLQPLVPYHLGQTSEGDYHRQTKQNDIPYQPISSFEKKVLFFANVDTSGFRTSASKYSPVADLDYLVNLTIYKTSTNALGSTKTAPTTIPRGVIDTIDFFSSIPTDQQANTVGKTKLAWTMATGENPSFITLRYLEETLGIQSVPLFICEEGKFTSPVQTKGAKATVTTAPTEPESSKENQLGYLLSYWSKVSYRPKPKEIRFVKPDNFTPAAPSPKVDAMGGAVQSPQV
jgi:hypothetical protein